MKFISSRNVSIVALLMAMGCAERQPAEESYQVFPLTVVLTDSVASDLQSPPPEDLRKFALPFPGVGCPLVFFPQLSFVRRDHDPGKTIQFKKIEIKEIVVEAKKLRQRKRLGFLQIFYAQPPSVKELHEVVSLMLQDAADWTALAASGERPLDMKSLVSFTPGTQGRAKTFVMAQPGAETDNTLERIKTEIGQEQEVVLAANDRQLTALTGAYLCDHFASVSGTEQPSDLPPVVVLYQPVNEKRTVVAKEEVTSREVAKRPESEGENLRIAEEPGPLAENLRRIREDFEQGRLRQALQAAESLRRGQRREDVQQLLEEIEKEVGGRIEVKLRGGGSGHYTLNAQSALVTLVGKEQSFLLHVKPDEEVYFYLYQEDSSGRLEALFPDASSHIANPLSAGQETWLPRMNAQGGYPFASVKKVYIVTSRWPARELEHWGAELVGSGENQASTNLVQALLARRDAHIGGCDVRTLQFARTSEE